MLIDDELEVLFKAKENARACELDLRTTPTIMQLIPSHASTSFSLSATYVDEDIDATLERLLELAQPAAESGQEGRPGLPTQLQEESTSIDPELLPRHASGVQEATDAVRCTLKQKR